MLGTSLRMLKLIAEVTKGFVENKVKMVGKTLETSPRRRDKGGSKVE